MPETTAKPINWTARAKKALSQEEALSKGKKAPTAAKKTGRPSKYDPEIARVICEELSEGIPLRKICRDNEGFPAWRTVYDWMAKDDALGERGVGLSASITRARDIGCDALAEECLIIADTPQFGQVQTMTDKGSSTTIEDMLGHRKLQIETRLKLLAKFHPTKYGDRVAIEGVKGGAPIATEDATSTRLFELMRNMEMTKRVG
jgi:hypothetical protein